MAFAQFGIIAIFLATGAGSALAHGTVPLGQSLWTAWNPTFEITLGSLILAGLYGAGIWRRRRQTDRVRVWRHVSFFAGLGAIYFALQSPMDLLAERVFIVHQGQHLLVRMIGPMLLFLSLPQGLLVAGMPGWAQQRIVVPVLTNGVIRRAFGLLSHPVVVTALFVGTLYVWQIPKLHNLALFNDGVHYLMHASMLIPGLLFFWRLFDSRPPPMGTRYGMRLMMLWIMILSNIVIGSYLAFKQPVLYSAYGELGRLWDISALDDELLGGALIWMPSSMMGVVAILIVVHMWGRREEKDETRRIARSRQQHGANQPPLMAADLIQAAAGKNRAMALGFIGFSFAVFVAAIAIGVINLMIG